MNWKIIGVILLVGCLFLSPFFQKGYFETHDGEWAIVRLAEMSREIRDFQIPPRWSDFLNHGFGYPLFLYIYPLPYYFGVLLKLTGLSLTDSIKAEFILGTLISGLGMYFYAKRYWGYFGGLISSIFFIILPYRLIDLYVRGSLGEIVALAVVPWLFWSVDRLLSHEQKTTTITAILFSLLILSHNASALLFFILLIIYVLVFFWKRKKEVIKLGIAIFQGFLLTSFFWLPVLFEKNYVYLGHTPIANRSLHFITILELLRPLKEITVRPPVFIGFAHLLVLVLVVILYLFNRKLKHKSLLAYSLIVIFISLIPLFSYTSFIWSLPIVNLIDFPWRLLIVTGFLLSFISGSIVFFPKGKILGLAILVIGIGLCLPLVRAQKRIDKDDSYYETNDATTTSNDELMPIWVEVKPTNRYTDKIISDSSAVSNLSYNSKQIKFNLNTDRPGFITINSIYFPGWVFTIDKQQTQIILAKGTGLITLFAPQGVHTVEGKFNNTKTRFIADILSFFGLISLFIINKYRPKDL